MVQMIFWIDYQIVSGQLLGGWRYERLPKKAFKLIFIPYARHQAVQPGSDLHLHIPDTN